jgi:3-methylcrotonyl-CoA carboxylase alpha subunit
LLEQTVVWPVRTNAWYLVRALQHADFATGRVDTGLLGREGDTLAVPPEPTAELLALAASDLIAATEPQGFRLNADPRREAVFALDSQPVSVVLEGTGSLDPMPSTVISQNGQSWRLSLWRAKAEASASAADGAILAPMPGKVIAVDVAEGETVSKGQRLMVLEAMKMEHALVAPFDGTVGELTASEGQQVQVEALLARVEKAEE